VIYLDSAAIVKLVHTEPESGALDLWLAEHIGMPRVSSAIAEIEVPRAIRRCAPAAQARIPMVMGTVARVEIDIAIRTLAASYQNPTLRSLDAIHLATAQLLATEMGEPPAAFVTYDKRLLKAAAGAGLPTASPGAVGLSGRLRSRCPWSGSGRTGSRPRSAPGRGSSGRRRRRPRR
jgi:predicted nucleic acid-binding protein